MSRFRVRLRRFFRSTLICSYKPSVKHTTLPSPNISTKLMNESKLSSGIEFTCSSPGCFDKEMDLSKHLAKASDRLGTATFHSIVLNLLDGGSRGLSLSMSDKIETASRGVSEIAAISEFSTTPSAGCGSFSRSEVSLGGENRSVFFAGVDYSFVWLSACCGSFCGLEFGVPGGGFKTEEAVPSMEGLRCFDESWL